MLTRRQLLLTGSLGAFGLSLPELLAGETRQPRRHTPKSCIFIFLWGGPSHIDMWDMKPDAPAEYRGPFKPIATAVPGTRICEHLPRMARLAGHYTILRTLQHGNTTHGPAASWVLTGTDPQSPLEAAVLSRADDPPGLGALAARLRPSPPEVPSAVQLPQRLSAEGRPFRGQAGGWLGGAYEPLVPRFDVRSQNFLVEGLGPQESLPPERLEARRVLLRTLAPAVEPGKTGSEPLAVFQRRAFDLLAQRQAQRAFDLAAEPAAVRDRYGRTALGQCCLAARRLVEAGVRLVTVMDAVSELAFPWDTHVKNFTLLKDKLLPTLDQAYSALLEDLVARGLLADTVVYLGGEFGRTPKAGADSRDHYAACFSGVLAGGGTRPGMVYGSSDARAAFPTGNPVSPEDLAATLFAAMDLDPTSVVTARDGRPMSVSHGKPIAALLA